MSWAKKNCLSRHDDNMCFLPNCRYHIILLLGSVDELLKMWELFCFSYQHVDCLYTLLKYRFSGKIVLKSWQIDNLQKADHFRWVDRMPSIAKKRLLRKFFKKHLISSFQKTKALQTCGSVSAERIGKLKKTKFELELKKIVDCFLDVVGNYDSN